MQHERIWQPDKAAPSENVGDVLSSIRRLIAQDQAKLPCGRTLLESQPCASAQTLTPELRPPFVLGRKDMVAPQPEPEPEREAPRLHLASVSAPAVPLADQDRMGAWRPSPIPEWPIIHPRLDLPQVASNPVAAGLSPEDETEFAEIEFAEAEAALARMTAPRPEKVAQLTTAAVPDADMADFKETQMAQDMRMMDMGRIDDISAIRPIPTAEGFAFGTSARDEGSAPNLFGEIGGLAKDATLRTLIRDAIQTELHGELGARLSRNMCQMIRQEVEAVIREICAES